MNRFLQYFNFLGIMALAVLCAVQWRTDSRLNMQVTELDITRLRQLAQISEQARTIQGCTADLEDFRQRLLLSESQLKDIDEQLKQRTRERDQLKDSLGKWVAAVAARDEELKRVAKEIQTLGTERNDAVTRFNDLAGKYNKLVKDWNASQGRN